MKKRLPKLKSDRAAKELLKKDLSDFISPDNFTTTSFEFAPKKQKHHITRLERSLGSCVNFR